MKLSEIKRVSLFVLLIILGQQMAGAAPAKTIDLFPICVGKKYVIWGSELN